MELSRQEYPAMLASLQPLQASALLSERVKHVNRLNTEVAEWLQERRRVEEAYVAGLRRLTRKQLGEDSNELGIFSTPWSKIVAAAETLAESHHTLAQKIDSDIERPLREFPTSNREMQAMSTIMGNLHAMAKEVENAQKRVEKLKERGGKASADKVASAQQELDNAQSQWDSQAPYVFEKLQQVDEHRCNHMRDVLTQFQTHEVDQVERSRTTAEETLNVLLNIETADEIKTWSLKALSTKPTLERKRSNRPPNLNASLGVPSSLSTAPSVIHTDDGASQRSGSGAVQEKDKPHGGLKSLKRFGTVLSRKRQSTHPYGRAGSPERKSATNISSFSPFGSRSGRSKDKQILPSTMESSAVSQARRRSSSHTQAFVGLGESGTSSGPQAQPTSDKPNDTIINSSMGGPSLGADLVNGGPPLQIPQLQEPLEPSPQLPTSSEPRKDPEIYEPPPGPPPSHIDHINQAEQEAASTSESTGHLKVDIRNAPIQEEDGDDADAALANVANTLRAIAAPPRKSGTVRGRRDVRNTMFVPSPQSLTIEASAPGKSSPAPSNSEFPVVPTPVVQQPTISSSQPVPSSPFRPTHRAVFSADDGAPSDTQSVRSGRSLSSAASMGAVKHPDMHGQGLNVSIVEIASATFEKGTLTKAAVIGELALVFNPVDISIPFGTESIRFDNFQILEKVAPNPTFIENVPEQAGYYSVNLASITKTTVAFKYQIHLDESNRASFAPLLLEAHWKCEAAHTSVILSYSANPGFNFKGKQSVTLANVVVIIHIEGAKPTSAQSKPDGNLQKERSLMYWRIGDVSVAADSAPQQIRARLFTDTEARPGKVEARWEISGEHVTGLGSGLSVSQLHQGSTAAAGPEKGENSDPFADVWSEVTTARKLSSGAYEALP